MDKRGTPFLSQLILTRRVASQLTRKTGKLMSVTVATVARERAIGPDFLSYHISFPFSYGGVYWSMHPVHRLSIIIHT